MVDSATKCVCVTHQNIYLEFFCSPCILAMKFDVMQLTSFLRALIVKCLQFFPHVLHCFSGILFSEKAEG